MVHVHLFGRGSFSRIMISTRRPHAVTDFLMVWCHVVVAIVLLAGLLMAARIPLSDVVGVLSGKVLESGHIAAVAVLKHGNREAKWTDKLTDDLLFAVIK